jgi:chromosome segregation ATPase
LSPGNNTDLLKLLLRADLAIQTRDEDVSRLRNALEKNEIENFALRSRVSEWNEQRSTEIAKLSDDLANLREAYESRLSEMHQAIRGRDEQIGILSKANSDMEACMRDLHSSIAEFDRVQNANNSCIATKDGVIFALNQESVSLKKQIDSLRKRNINLSGLVDFAVARERAFHKEIIDLVCICLIAHA